MTQPQTGHAPILLIIAGPNGSGKSTFTRNTRAALQVPVIDPDQEARLIRPDAPEAAAMEAGRQAILHARAYLVAGQSFVIETTLAGNLQLRLMEEAKQSGYEVELIFIGVESADISIARVAARVAKGGHNVPADDVRRRYHRGMGNLTKAVRLADRATLYDNSSEQGHREALAIEHGHVVAQSLPLPQWVLASLGSLLGPNGEQ